MSAAEHSAPALELRDLDVVYRVRGRDREVLRGVSLEIGRGEAYGLVGESGCGKSTAALAIVRYLPSNGRVVSGSIHVDGEDMLAHSRATLRRLRAEKLSMVYQNPAPGAEPVDPGRPAGRGGVPDPRRGARRGAGRASRTRSRRCRSPTRRR